MQISLHLVLWTVCLSLVAGDNINSFLPQQFKFDHVEFPLELKYSSFSVTSHVDRTKQFEQAAEALFAVSVRLKALLDEGSANQNFLVSPLSVALTFGQLLLGARGESRHLLSEILSTARQDGAGAAIPDVEFHQQFKTLLRIMQTSASENGTSQFENYELHIANAFFVHPDLRLRPDYKHAVTDFYESDVIPLDFSGNPLGAQETINQWVNQNTRGHIASLLSFPLPPTTASLIANAIYFRGAWENPFDPDLTINGTFKINSKERVAVSYMRGQFELLYTESERLRCQMVVLPYKHRQASMHIFLPFEKDYDIRNFTEKFTVNDAVELKLAASERSVTLIMPRMMLTGKFSLKESLARFKKLQQRPSHTSATTRRPARPTATRHRGKRGIPINDHIDSMSKNPFLKKSMEFVKRNARGIGSENNSSPKDIYDERMKVGVNNSQFATKVNNENTFINDRNVTHEKLISSDVGVAKDEADLTPEDSIKTEIITSSIMVPAMPLIVMEVDKTYTVGLNSSHPSHNENYSSRISDKFPPRQGEFDANFQISTPLLSNYKPANYQTQYMNNHRHNDKYHRPAHQGSSADQISFPPDESVTNRQGLKQTTAHSEVSFYSSVQSGQAGFTAYGQSPESAHSVPLPIKGGSYPAAGVPMNSLSSNGEGDIDFDLTGASEDSRFRIDDILHQMWLEVTETGTEAAAVSAGAVDYSGDVKLVLVDRPFLLVIQHEETRAVLFWGAITDPTGGAGLRTEDPLGRPPAVKGSVVHSRGR